MPGLRTMVESLGYDDVRTHLQSGNVIFTSGAIGASKLEEQLRTQLAAEFKVDSPVLVRTSQQLAQVVKANPFIKKGLDPKQLHVAFLSKKPAAKEVAAIDAEKSLPDEFAFGDRAIYLRLVNGVQGSRLPNWDRLLSVGRDRAHLEDGDAAARAGRGSVNTLEGRRAVITGGASGIGFATAQALPRPVPASCSPTSRVTPWGPPSSGSVHRWVAHGVRCDVTYASRSRTSPSQLRLLGGRARRVQQRRRRRRRPDRRDDPRRLAVDHRRRPVGPDPRRRGVPAPDGRAGRGRSRAVHRLVRRAGAQHRARPVLRGQVRRRRPGRGARPRAARRTRSACRCCARCGWRPTSAAPSATAAETTAVPTADHPRPGQGAGNRDMAGRVLDVERRRPAHGRRAIVAERLYVLPHEESRDVDPPPVRAHRPHLRGATPPASTSNWRGICTLACAIRPPVGTGRVSARRTPVARSRRLVRSRPRWPRGETAASPRPSARARDRRRSAAARRAGPTPGSTRIGASRRGTAR